MIELQTALVIAGLVLFIVVVIISYDRYRLARIREKQETRIEQLDVELQEPLLVRHDEMEIDSELPTESGQVVLSPDDKPIEPTVPLDVNEFEQDLRDAEEVAHTPIHGINVRVPEPTHLAEDGIQIDFVARVPGKNVIKRDTALGLYRQYDYELNKPHRLFGLTYPSQVWADLERESELARFTHFGMTLQLADRDGPVTASELHQFSQLVLRFAEVFGRRFTFSMGLEEALEHAKTVDEFCKKYDALAIVNVLTRQSGGFRGGDIQQFVRGLGMELNRKNFYEKRKTIGGGSRTLYSLANLFGSGEFQADNMQDFHTDGLTLFMNIPATAKPADTFRQMVIDAKALCDRLNGKLVDQNRKVMTEQGLQQIGQQIRNIELEMEREHVTPGSELAMRLF